MDCNDSIHLFEVHDKAAPIHHNGSIFHVDTKEKFQQFIQEFQALPLMTYRRDFPKLLDSEYTSDAGWGCMIRSAQMLIATALQRCYKNQACSLDLTEGKPVDDFAEVAQSDKLLKLFLDSPDPDHIYSIHNVCLVGRSYSMVPGEWYGPTIISKVVRDLSVYHRQHLGGHLAVYVSRDAVVYMDDIEELMTSGESRKSEDSMKALHLQSASHAPDPRPAVTATVKPTARVPAMVDPLLNIPKAEMVLSPWDACLLLLIPVRLGPTCLNESYIPSLLALLSQPQSIGFVGGKPSSAYYFSAFQNHNVVYLDPHTVQPSVSISELGGDGRRSYEPKEVRTMLIEKIDPSLSLGFVCKDREELAALSIAVETLNKRVMPIISFADCVPKFEEDMAVADLLSDGGGEEREETTDDDGDGGFVFI